jgi:non-specific serine/threonine protein kinase
MAAEHDNLRAALGWAVTGEDAARAQRLAGPLWGFWFVRGHWREGQRWLEAALALPGEVPARAHAWALGGAGALAAALGDFERAAPLLEESLARWRALDDRKQLGRALQNLAALAYITGDLDRAEMLAEESLAVRQGTSEAPEALRNLGSIAEARSNLQRAIALYEEVLARYRESNNRWGVGNALAELAWLALEQGELARGRAFLGECLTLRRTIADTPGIAECLELAATVVGIEARAVDAAHLAGAAAAQREAGDHPAMPIAQSRYARLLAAARAQVDDDAWAIAWAEGSNMALDDALALADAELATAQDD